ncbi:chitin synthase-domain-containing protein [Naematelia encephala]|uniref:chitin synthase n=1 Tax=Naematelia encephala TaxID=71784 RepID=A0A1Y2AM25_9TREE|nr:chitin synthase-domain-containing protein [Naematelia encephala]
MSSPPLQNRRQSTRVEAMETPLPSSSSPSPEFDQARPAPPVISNNDVPPMTDEYGQTPEQYYSGSSRQRREPSSVDPLLRRQYIDPHEDPYNLPTALYTQQHPPSSPNRLWSDYTTDKLPLEPQDHDGEMIVREKKHHQTTEVSTTTRARRWWLRITWLLTWWVPSFLLRTIGKMDRADVRMAWREKLAIVEMITAMCGIVIFYIIVFGRLLCPESAKAWNETELAQHAGDDDYYAAIAGKVYDFTNFYKGQHSDIQAYTTSSSIMLEFAGQDLTNYFPPPMTVACPGLVTDDQLSLLRANFTPIVAYAVHTSGPLQTINGTKLDNISWYEDDLQTSLLQWYKGSFVFEKSQVASGADSDSKSWAIYKNKVYDLSDYLYTQQYYSSSSGTDLPNYSFLNTDLTNLFQTNAGQDITKQMTAVLAKLDTDDAANQLKCLDNAFFLGQTDFRKTPRCTVQNYLLLAFSIILISTIAAKFLAALQLGSKRQPELLDKFVICQVPCYTEGEESLRKTIDSLAALRYDDKRKLIFIICDGNIIGSGNNRPTPRVVLDILGVDPNLDPEPLLFKSIGDGSRQLNYAKVYSGLYEFEGHVVPYVVVVKVGKPTETSRPGNRGKRDSQVLLMQYLNRVHFDAPMSPLELEIYHQMRNVIGIDPAFYEYIFQVDADTTVTPDSLNRMIACTSDDSRIIGICGETKVANERESLTTMIQVYEYYISHHLTKAFESLFGSVTCLPGCFSVYRIRTADRGRPVIISSLVIDEYAEPNVDTLHKKNLFSLGEDRYLTTLMMKHFPTFKMKFTPDAIAHTMAPSKWNVLLSQRRRWINSTIHNLVELLFLPEMCGFCFFSMRFIVFIDLLGTIILPATCVYLIYLIIVVASGKAAIPVISLAMIGAVYGLQAIIFILKREFMLIGWMVVYILAFPIYSFFLPVYSFWSMDDFSWGNTRKVVGEGDKKTVVYEDDEPFQDSMIPYKSFKEYESNAWETASLHSEKSRATSHTSATRTTRNDRRMPSNRAPSVYSSASDLPPGADFYRDSSPLRPRHSSRNLWQMGYGPSIRPSNSNPYLADDMARSRLPSMAGMSMWGDGSVYGGPAGQAPNPFNQPPPGFMQPPYLQPMHTGPSMGMMGMGMPMNPFGSLASRSDAGSLRPPTFYPPYPGPGQSQMMGMGAPRGSVMTNLGGPVGPQQRDSSYSLAMSGAGAPGGGESLVPVPSEKSDPSDEEILGVLRRFLASQDLMTVTKRQTRQAIFGLFPNADLESRTAWVNENIDKILSEQ